MKPRNFGGFLTATLLLAALMAPPGTAFADDDDDDSAASFAGVGSFFGPEEIDGSSILVRAESGVAYTLSTRELEPGAAYTNWWVAFNNPEDCVDPCNCSDADFDNPDEVISVFWATGRVADDHGQGDFAANVDFGELPPNPNQVAFGLANPIVPGAEVHVIVRTHGQASTLPRALEAQLTEFNGGCTKTSDDDPPGDACFDVQFSVHRSPVCRPGDDDD